MYKLLFSAILLSGILTWMSLPSMIQAQFGGGRPPRWGGGKGFGQDPNARFDFFAKDRPFFLISESRW